MKKLFILSAFVITITAHSQNVFPDNGNVGIGTLIPSTKLDVVGSIKGQNGIFTKPLPNGSTFLNVADRNAKCSVLNAGTKLGATAYILNVLDFPQSNIDPQAQSFIGIEDRNLKSRWRFYANAGGSSELLYFNKNQSQFFKLHEDGTDNVFLSLEKANSYVTIGTNSHTDNGDIYKLTVNGKVRAHAVKVYTDWADFVFSNDYILKSLEEVEEFIKNNGHLENIPSAEEVEENGIELGEMNKLLLQKIEELTLYTIDLQKQINTLSSKLN